MSWQLRLAIALLKLRPRDPRGYALKARALMWSDPGAAIPAAVSGLEHGPEFAPLHAALAIAYTNIGRYSEGLQRGIRATEIDPLDAFSHRALAIPLIYTGRRNEAIAALESAVAINPNLTAPYFELALQYRQQDFQEMAVGIYRRILELEPQNAKAFLRICQTYAEVGEFLAATPFCETATELDDSYADAWQWLGQMRYTRRNYEGTLEAMEKCVELGSIAVECYYMRGWSYYVLDQCPVAWDVLQEALQYTSEPHIINIINDGLASVRANCPGFEDARLPTAHPANAHPPDSHRRHLGNEDQARLFAALLPPAQTSSHSQYVHRRRTRAAARSGHPLAMGCGGSGRTKRRRHSTNPNALAERTGDTRRRALHAGRHCRRGGAAGESGRGTPEQHRLPV